VASAMYLLDGLGQWESESRCLEVCSQTMGRPGMKGVAEWGRYLSIPCGSLASHHISFRNAYQVF
jgi:hypothetical protein